MQSIRWGIRAARILINENLEGTSTDTNLNVLLQENLTKTLENSFSIR